MHRNPSHRSRTGHAKLPPRPPAGRFPRVDLRWTRRRGITGPGGVGCSWGGRPSCGLRCWKRRAAKRRALGEVSRSPEAALRDNCANGRDDEGFPILRRHAHQREVAPKAVRPANPRVQADGRELIRIDLEVGRSGKRIARRPLRPKPSIGMGRTRVAGKGRANAGGDSEARHSGRIGVSADKQTPPRRIIGSSEAIDLRV